MSASYPSSIVAFDYKIDNRSKVVAADVNSAYDEINAIEKTLGTSVLSSSWSGDFNTSSTAWSSVGDRLQNIERGLSQVYNIINGGTP